jgi:hypothetical protein
MLDVARRRANEHGVGNVSFVQADVQTASFSGPRVAVVVSRFGTMFFSDPQTAFANVRAHLATDGRVRLATWRPLEQNEWLTVPGLALLPYVEHGAPESSGSAMFSQADPAAVRTVLEAAGFTAVDLEAVDVPLALGDTVDQAVEHLVDTGPGRAALDAIPVARRDDALGAVREALAPYASDTGVWLDGAVWIVSAR